MNILSHRGYWLAPEEKNQAVAIARTFKFGFGTETDVRDVNGRLVISHDPAGDGAMSLATVLQMVRAHGTALPLAINIKSDGLAPLLKEEMAKHGITDWFVFDMSVPDMRGHFREGNPVFTRMSEVERTPVWLEQAEGVWLDAFEERWYDETILNTLLSQGKKVCIVSAELHRRPHLPHWEWLKSHDLHRHALMMLCTDHPEDARSYFGEGA